MSVQWFVQSFLGFVFGQVAGVGEASQVLFSFMVLLVAMDLYTALYSIRACGVNFQGHI